MLFPLKLIQDTIINLTDQCESNLILIQPSKYLFNLEIVGRDVATMPRGLERCSRRCSYSAGADFRFCRGNLATKG